MHVCAVLTAECVPRVMFVIKRYAHLLTEQCTRAMNLAHVWRDIVLIVFPEPRGAVVSSEQCRRRGSGLQPVCEMTQAVCAALLSALLYRFTA